MSKTLLSYIPHGINTKKFFPITTETPEALEELTKFREFVYGGEDVNFSVLFLSRNIHRKHPSDVILAFRHFVSQLTPEEAEKCRLIMHTQPIDDHGTDLVAVNRDVAPEVKIIWSKERVPYEQLNLLYNLADVTINLASNEGFGLGTAESLMAGTPIVVNVTGGLQDQCGFKDENGNYLSVDHYTAEWGSNHDARYRDHGEWVSPVFPASISLQGSPATPYIFDDRCDWKDAGNKLLDLYRMSKEERQRRGLAGREYLTTQGFTAEDMCNSFITDMEKAWEAFTPREKFTLIKA